MKFTKDSDEFKFFREFYEVVKMYYEPQDDYWEKAISAIEVLCDRWKSNPRVHHLAINLGMAFLRFEDEEQSENTSTTKNLTPKSG